MIRTKRLTTKLLFFTLSVVGPALNAQMRPEDWKSVPIDMALVEDFIATHTPCDENERNQRACLELVNRIGKELNPPQMILPKGISHLYPELSYTVTRDLGEFEWVRIDQPARASQNNRETVDRFRGALGEQRAAIHRQWSSGHQIHFIDLARSFAEQLPANVIHQYVLGMAMNAAIQAVDGHAHIAPYEIEEQRLQDANPTRVGIGIELALANDEFKVNTVLDNSPAKRAGVEVGDLIVSIDGQSVLGKSLDDVSSLVRGEENKPVSLRIRKSQGSLEKDLTLLRSKVKFTNMIVRKVHDFGHEFLWIKLKSFDDRKVCDVLRTALMNAASDVEGLILDLRGNRGGLRDQAACVAGLSSEIH